MDKKDVRITLNNLKRSMVIFGLILYIILFCVNMLFYDKFFEIPIYNLLNLGIAILFAYYFVQKKNDERKLKEIVENIINKIQATVADEASSNFSNPIDTKKILQILRTTNNKIQILIDLEDDLNINDDVEFIKRNFNKYRELIGSNIYNIKILQSKEKELKKQLRLIENKCDELKVKLYKH